jgi:hypothetical protein
VLVDFDSHVGGNAETSHVDARDPCLVELILVELLATRVVIAESVVPVRCNPSGAIPVAS